MFLFETLNHRKVFNTVYELKEKNTRIKNYKHKKNYFSERHLLARLYPPVDDVRSSFLDKKPIGWESSCAIFMTIYVFIFFIHVRVNKSVSFVHPLLQLLEYWRWFLDIKKGFNEARKVGVLACSSGRRQFYGENLVWLRSITLYLH